MAFDGTGRVSKQAEEANGKERWRQIPHCSGMTSSQSVIA